MALTPKQIADLDAAAAKTNQTETDKANLAYAAKTYGYKAPAVDQAAIDAQYKNVGNQPVSGGSTIDEIVNAFQTGDFSTLKHSSGQPFSAADQQAAMAKATADLALSNAEVQAKDTADVQRTLGQNQDNYNDYLSSAATNFQTDKTNLDQNAADNGVLFSGGRMQKQQNLQNAYNQDQATQLRNATNNIAGTANDYQYKYGNQAAQGLSQYYNLGSNNYNAGQAQGGATTNGLSSVYNPSQSNFYGTQNAANTATAQTRAAGLLWNQGNKLVATGNKNKY